jgi:hypothetical protein
MTTIRKIVTSKIDGNSADTNDTNEIRPFGEIAVYLNTEPNPDKLTLMMFDGTRTHLKSMVLAPGRLYGSDADSGDGNGRDTIKLIPDASLSDYTGNDQYIIVDPTGGVPGHIHLRAGGTQDASTADLYLGGEQTFVRVSDTSDDVAIRTGLNSSVENVALDAADAFGPGVWRLFFIAEDYPNLGTNVQVGDTFTTSWGTPITATITNIVQDIGAGTWALHTNQDITAGVNPGDTVTFNRGPEALLITTRLQKTWTFANTGDLILPNGGEIRIDGTNIEVGGMTNFNVEAAGVANIYTDDGAYQWQFGDDGTLTLPGTMTIETTYGGAPTLVVDGKAHTVELRSDEYILIGYNNSSGNVYIGNQTSGQVDIVSNKFRVLAPAPSSSTGAVGDQLGQIAFDGSYIYYCTQDYVGNSTSVTTLASSGTTAWVDSTDYAGDLVADFTANPTGWTYNGVAIVNIVADNTFGPGYALEGPVGGFSVINSYNYALVNPSTLPNIWKRVAWGGSTW